MYGEYKCFIAKKFVFTIQIFLNARKFLSLREYSINRMYLLTAKLCNVDTLKAINL